MRSAILFCFLILLAFSYPALASSCTRDCEVNCTNAENNSACTSSCSSNCLDVIEQRNNANGSGPARMSYGAIAVSPSTFKYGYSWGQSSQNEANAVAFRNCGAQDCQIELTFYNTCGALAMTRTPPPDGVWGTAWADSKEQTEQTALGYCAQGGHADCVLEASVCSR